MEQRSSSGFGRGWVPMERDIGIPQDEWPAPRLAQSFTPERQVRFLHHLATSGHVRRACEAVGVSAQAAYVHKRRDAAFARGWDAALVLARDAAEEVLAERALNGTREMIFYRGEVVGSRIRFDPRLLLAHLARLDKHHAEAPDAAHIAARFDDYLGELLTGEPEFLVPLEESEPPEPTQWHPARPTREEALLAAREAALYDMPEDLADLPPETQEAFAAEELDEADRWPFAVATAQEAASATAAEAWDAETEAQHARLDALCSDETPPSALRPATAPFAASPCSAENAEDLADPPHFGLSLSKAQMGRGTAEGGGGGNPAPSGKPEPEYETKAFKFPPKTVSTVSTCRPLQQCNDIVFPFGSPGRSAKGRPAIAASQHNRQEPGTCFASLSHRSPLPR